MWRAVGTLGALAALAAVSACSEQHGARDGGLRVSAGDAGVIERAQELVGA